MRWVLMVGWALLCAGCLGPAPEVREAQGKWERFRQGAGFAVYEPGYVPEGFRLVHLGSARPAASVFVRLAPESDTVRNIPAPLPSPLEPFASSYRDPGPPPVDGEALAVYENAAGARLELFQASAQGKPPLQLGDFEAGVHGRTEQGTYLVVYTYPTGGVTYVSVVLDKELTRVGLLGTVGEGELAKMAAGLK